MYKDRYVFIWNMYYTYCMVLSVSMLLGPYKKTLDISLRKRMEGHEVGSVIPECSCFLVGHWVRNMLFPDKYLRELKALIYTEWKPHRQEGNRSFRKCGKESMSRENESRWKEGFLWAGKEDAINNGNPSIVKGWPLAVDGGLMDSACFLNAMSFTEVRVLPLSLWNLSEEQHVLICSEFDHDGVE